MIAAQMDDRKIENAEKDGSKTYAFNTNVGMQASEASTGGINVGSTLVLKFTRPSLSL